MMVPAAPIPDIPSNGSPAWMPTREDISLILETSTEAIFLTDQEGRILFANPVAQQLVGRRRDVIGLEFHDLIECLTFFPLREPELVRIYGLDITSDVALRRAKAAGVDSSEPLR